MKLADARRIAERLVSEMSPYCERIEIAGSIRREKAEVKDIEIVAVPRWTVDTEKIQLFDVAQVNLLYRWATHNLRWIKPGTAEIVDWMPKADGKYWRALVDEGIKLDLFITTLEQWGIIFMIRTGSAEYSRGLMTYAKLCTPYRVQDGHLTLDGQPVPTFEEEDVFAALGTEYVSPREREVIGDRWARSVGLKEGAHA